MNKIKKILIITISVLISPIFILVLVNGILYLTIPISRPYPSICAYIFQTIPFETKWEDAINIIDNHRKWEIISKKTDGGLVIYESGNIGLEKTGDEEDPSITIIGEKVLIVELGEYYDPFHTAVFAYLAFDENDKLIRVGIRKDVDAL